MSYMFRIVRGIIAGIFVFGVGSEVAFVSEKYFPAVSFSVVFISSVVVCSMFYVVWYLYMRRMYYKKFPKN